MSRVVDLFFDFERFLGPMFFSFKLFSYKLQCSIIPSLLQSCSESSEIVYRFFLILTKLNLAQHLRTLSVELKTLTHYQIHGVDQEHNLHRQPHLPHLLIPSSNYVFLFLKYLGKL